VSALAIPHHAVALKDRALFDHERRSVDVAVDLSVAVNLDALRGDDFSDGRSADRDATDQDVALDRRALADDQFIFRNDLAVETAVDAHRVFEFQLAFEHGAAVKKPVELTAAFAFHRRLPVKSSKMRIRSSSLAKRM